MSAKKKPTSLWNTLKEQEIEDDILDLEPLDDDTPEAAADEAGNAATEQGALDGFSGEAFS